MGKTLRSKVEKSKRGRLVEPRTDARTTVTFRPKTGRRRKTSDGYQAATANLSTSVEGSLSCADPVGRLPSND